jgi:diadenosine tetraphosphate (Ap4A) HIT family hydrolase
MIETKKDKLCPFCSPILKKDQIILQNTHCYFIQQDEPVLIGSGLIIPRRHVETPFDLNENEWADTLSLLLTVKNWMDERYIPDGYNLGWNCGKTAGQEVLHAHLHVIPRFEDEPMAGKGIRYLLKQKTNQRPGT